MSEVAGAVEVRHPAGSSRADVLGCSIDRLGMEETVARCEALIEAGGPAQQVSINVAKLMSLRSDPRLREIVEGCELVNADGQPVVWASRLLGDPLPERVAGIDLMARLLELAERKGYRVFVLGAREEVLEAAVQRIRDRHPRLDLAGYRHGYFEEDERETVAAEIRAAEPQLLFVAMSSPRKEYWLGEDGRRLGVPFVMGVGGAVDVLAGKARRAPVWMRRAGLEWLYRLLQEPARLGPRYLTTNLRFALRLGRELTRRTRREATR